MALVKCPECHSQVSDQAVVCPNCGFPLTEKPPPPQAYPPADQRPAKKGVPLWAALIAAAVIGAAIYLLFDLDFPL